MTATTLWRTGAQLMYYVGQFNERALVWIPTMKAEHDVHVVPSEVVPPEVEKDGRFYLRCTLDHNDFIVAAEKR